MTTPTLLLRWEVAMKRLILAGLALTTCPSAVEAQMRIEAAVPRALEFNTTVVFQGPDRQRIDRLQEALTAQIEKRNWRAAIESALALSPFVPKEWPDYLWDKPWVWNVGVAELYLYDGRPEAAVKELDRLFKGIPPAKGMVRDYSEAREDACYAMARAKAELGDFQSALKW